MKTNDELKILKQEYETLRNKLQELSDEEIAFITGGFDFDTPEQNKQYEQNIYEEPNMEQKKEEFKPKF